MFLRRTKKRRTREEEDTRRGEKRRGRRSSSGAAERKIANILRHERHRAGDEPPGSLCILENETTLFAIYSRKAEAEIRRQRGNNFVPLGALPADVSIGFHGETQDPFRRRSTEWLLKIYVTRARCTGTFIRSYPRDFLFNYSL